MKNQDRVLVGKRWNSTLNVYKYSGTKSTKKKIKPTSQKRAKENREYLNYSRPEYLLEHPICEINVPGCTIKADQIHHKKGRIGKLLNDKKYFCATCDNCHKWAENNPAAAREKGVSISRLNIE